MFSRHIFGLRAVYSPNLNQDCPYFTNPFTHCFMKCDSPEFRLEATPDNTAVICLNCQTANDWASKECELCGESLFASKKHKIHLENPELENEMAECIEKIQGSETKEPLPIAATEKEVFYETDATKIKFENLPIRGFVCVKEGHKIVLINLRSIQTIGQYPWTEIRFDDGSRIDLNIEDHAKVIRAMANFFGLEV